MGILMHVVLRNVGRIEDVLSLLRRVNLRVDNGVDLLYFALMSC